MLLVKLKFIHFSPKDSEVGVREIILANNLEEAVNYIDKNYFYGHLFDNYQDEEEQKEIIGIYADKDILTEDFKRKATELGLKIDNSSFVNGTRKQMITLFEGNMFEEPVDCYYGATQYSWNEHEEITQEVADALTFLKINGIVMKTLIKDIR